MGGRGSRSALSNSKLGTADWDEWSLDPSIFQRLERGEDLSEDFRDMYDEEDWRSEYSRIKRAAKEMQSQAESTTVGTDTLYRGEQFTSLEAAQRKYAIGNTITLDKLTSYSKDKSLATEYAMMYGNSHVAVVITNKSTQGNFVGAQASHTAMKNDPEVVVPRGLSSKVTAATYDKSKNTLYVTMTTSARPKKIRRKG